MDPSPLSGRIDRDDFCPVPGCPCHHSNRRAVPWTDGTKTLTQHLREVHKNDPSLEKVTDETLKSLGVFVCRTCGQTLQSPKALTNHQRNCKPKLCTRTTPNYQLATSLFFAPHHSLNSTTTNHWAEALNWLHDIKDLPPPPSDSHSYSKWNTKRAMNT